MEIRDAVNKAVLAGKGAQEMAKEFVDELVKRGKVSATEGEGFVKGFEEKAKEFGERAQRGAEDIKESLAETYLKTLEKMNIPTREEYAKLEAEVKALKERINALEQRGGGSC